MEEDGKQPPGEQQATDVDIRKLAYDIIQNIASSANRCLPRNSEGDDSKNSEASSCTCTGRTSERRALYTLVPVEVNGQLEVLAVPPLCAVCSKFLETDSIYTSESFRAAGVGESSVRWKQPGEVVENKAKNSDLSNLSSFLPRGLDFGCTSTDATKEDKHARKNSKKQSRKKGKKNKRIKNKGANRYEASPGKRVPQTSTSEIGDHPDMVGVEVSEVCSAVENLLYMQKRCNKSMHSEGLSNMHTSSGGSNSNASSNLRRDVETVEGECSKSDVPHPQDSISRHGHFSSSTWSDGVMYTFSQPEEIKDDSQDCSGTAMQWTLVGKKGRITKTVPEISHDYSLSNENGQMRVCNPCTQKASDDYSDSSVEEIEFSSVDEACRLHLQLEALKLPAGGPVAEFEKLLDLFSPVICRPLSASACEVAKNQAVGTPLYREKTANFSLKNLWEWYETPGSYGVAIRAVDNCKSMQPGSLGTANSAYNAHFVPLLSAVQLFRIRSPGMSNKSHEEIAPQPCNDDINTLLRPYQLCTPKSCGESTESSRFALSKENQWHQDSELLFEYFESDQPWKRPTFYNKIQDLIKCDGPSNLAAYGNPACLNCMKLHDLHPRSWYAVAWYPIYTIPDGRSPGAFLTYHSLGHLVNRNISYAATSEPFIASPVVGLQIYDAQGKCCWFHPRTSVLEERLRRLEETASFMARSPVKKGNITSANRHPDFEFFLSRRRA